jgi:hypothetical protein
MGTSSSNSVGPFDVSAQISPPGDPDKDGTRVRVAAQIRQQLGQRTRSVADFCLAEAAPEHLADRIGKEQLQAAGSQAGTREDDKLTKLETSIRSPQGAPGARRLPRCAQLPAVHGLPSVNAPTTVSNSRSFEPEAWMPTPLLLRPGDSFSNRMKFLSAGAVAGLLAGYFVFGSSDRPVDVAVAPRPTIDIPPVAFLPLREVEAPSAEARDITLESRAEPEVQMASSQPTVRLDIKPTESGVEARPPQTLPERGRQLFAATGHDSSCFPSASAVRQNDPGAWPSWTLRAPGHEGTRCWYAATRTMAEAEARGITVGSRAEPEVQTASSQSRVRLDIKSTESEIEARPPQTLPERGRQLFAATGHDSSCFPSASAVRQNDPGAWPSWTLRAPGHEGTRCWYAATRTTANDHRSEMVPRKETFGTPEKLGSPGVLFGVQAADQGNADAQNSRTVAAPRGQSNIVTSAATIASSGTTQQDGEAATQAARVGAADRASGQALNPAQEAALNDGVLQARACIRGNIRAAYQSSESVDQAASFLMRSCFGPFSSAIPSGEASARTLFKGIVIQEISPDEWLRALEERAAPGR